MTQIFLALRRLLDLLTSRAFDREARALERKPGPTTPDQKTMRTTLRKSSRLRIYPQVCFGPITRSSVFSLFSFKTIASIHVILKQDSVARTEVA